MSIETKKKWMQPGFLIAVIILAAAAIGLNTAVSALQLSFKKESVPLVQELTTIPEQVGDWLQVSKDEPLPHDVADALATDQYIFRDYVNTKLLTKTDLAEFEGKTATERKVILARLQSYHPEAVINMAVTYYTGGVDTVAHIPDRCYIADGFQPSNYETPAWDVGPAHLGPNPNGPIDVRFINFEDQTTQGRVTRHVAYFFFTNGHYESDPIGVRETLQNLRYKHGFYSKIELMNIVKDSAESEQVMKSFLTAALPHVEKCLPDWNSVEGVSVPGKRM